jgi:hypothetical protein
MQLLLKHIFSYILNNIFVKIIVGVFNENLVGGVDFAVADIETLGKLEVLEEASHFGHCKAASFDYNTHCTYFISKAGCVAYLLLNF